MWGRIRSVRWVISSLTSTFHQLFQLVNELFASSWTWSPETWSELFQQHQNFTRLLLLRLFLQREHKKSFWTHAKCSYPPSKHKNVHGSLFFGWIVRYCQIRFLFVKLSFFLSFLLNKLLENIPKIPQTFLRLRISCIMLTCLLACYIVSLTPEAKC